MADLTWLRSSLEKAEKTVNGWPEWKRDIEHARRTARYERLEEIRSPKLEEKSNPDQARSE